MQPYLYILTNRNKTVLYTGVTSDLPARIFQHKNGLISGFSKRYNLHCLIFAEVHATMESAIQREKLVKRWKRSWKEDLIATFNPEWHDLAETLLI